MRLTALVFAFWLVSAAAGAADHVRLLLAETATREVVNDLSVAQLEGREEAATAAEAQAGLNEVMTQALEVAEGTAEVTARTTGYSVYSFRREDERVRWVATQGLALESADAGRLLELVGELQGIDLAVQQLGGRLSDGLANRVRDELTVEALDELRRRADLAAETLGLIFHGWEEVALDGVPSPRPMMMDAAPRAAAAEAMPPVMTETLSTSRVTIRATARLN